MRNQIKKAAIPITTRPREQEIAETRQALRSPVLSGKLIESWIDPMTGDEDTYDDKDGHLLPCILLYAGESKDIPHGLGREYSEWWVVRQFDGVTGGIDEVVHSRMNEVLRLRPTDDCAIRIRVC